MKSKQQIEDRLSELNEKYRRSRDMCDPVTHARIQELHWILEDEKYISHDG